MLKKYTKNPSPLDHNIDRQRGLTRLFLFENVPLLFLTFQINFFFSFGSQLQSPGFKLITQNKDGSTRTEQKVSFI